MPRAGVVTPEFPGYSAAAHVTQAAASGTNGAAQLPAALHSHDALYVQKSWPEPPISLISI